MFNLPNLNEMHSDTEQLTYIFLPFGHTRTACCDKTCYHPLI